MKYPKTITKLLNNKTVFYIVAFFAIANILGYFFLGNFTGILLFLVIGGITCLFEKNKTFVLFVALVVTSLLMMAGKRVKEGLENKKKNDSSKNKDSSTIVHPAPEPDSQEKAELNEDSSDKSGEEPEGAEPMKNNSKDKKWGSRIDHAQTIEDSYGQLSKILGSDGIKGLTNDTRTLMKQQMDLTEAMKGMMPVVKQAQDMMKGFDLGELGGLADLAKQFTASKKE